MTVVAPVRSDEQRMIALARANEIRVARAVLKRAIAAGGVDPAETIRRPPDFCLTMRVQTLLEAIPKFGRVKTNRLMQVARISSGKTLGGMSDRQRGELASLLTNRGWIR